MFDPTNGFGKGPILPEALAAAEAFLKTLPDVPPRDLLRGYYHWSVAGYACIFHDYNVMIILKDGKWTIVMTDSPADNAPGVNNNPVASHTWHRNTGAFGVSVSGMDGATTSNFGPDPVQMHEIEFQCAAMAALCVKYGVDTMGTVPAPGSNHTDDNGNNVNTTGEPNLLTHAECAIIDAYPTERWDEGSFIPLPSGVSLTPEMRTTCGNALRSRTHEYAAALKG